MLAFDAMNAFLEAEAVDLFRIVHGEQKFAYERPIVPGDVLTATLTVAGLRQIARQRHHRHHQRDHRRRRRPGLHHRRHPGPPGARRMSLATADLHVTRADLVRYAGASGDHNPIHQDEPVAPSVGLPGVIAHGMYTMALAARAVVDWTRGAEVVGFGCKFTNPVVVPDDGGGRGRGRRRRRSRSTTASSRSRSTVTCAGQKVLGMPKAVVRA